MEIPGEGNNISLTHDVSGNSPPSPLHVLLPLSLRKGLQRSAPQLPEWWAEEWAWWGQAAAEQHWVWLPWQEVGLKVQPDPQVVDNP